MVYPEGVLAIGSLLLILMGGIAGNIITVLVLRIKQHRTQNVTSSHYILLGLLLLFLVIAIAPFLNILFFTIIATNPIIFFLCIGILFGIIGSIYANFFGAAFERHIDSKIRDNCWLNADGKSMLWYGGFLVVSVAYLLWLFFQFT